MPMQKTHLRTINLLNTEAQIDPKHIQYLSQKLKRTVVQEKQDTRNYKNEYVTTLNHSLIKFMNAGIKDALYPGESLLIKADIDKSQFGSSELADLLIKTMETKHDVPRPVIADEPIIPFCGPISDDIQNKYILRTNSHDTFDSILSEIEAYRSKFINDSDWTLILTAINYAIARINKEQIVFLSPLDEGVIGVKRELTKSELELYGLGNENYSADIRNDSHDLVSLKELASVMSGNSVDCLSPFAGAFSKYMPELNALGIRGVCFEVLDEKLKSIRLSKFEDSGVVPFGPAEAAICVAQCFPEIKAYTDLKKGHRIYVSVSGYICAPDDINHFGYTEVFPKLTKIVKAAETILFQVVGESSRARKDTVASTRLYFYPYKPSDLHPVYQRMTLLIGHSDNMFHSCAYDPEHIFHGEEYEKTFNSKVGGNLFDYQPVGLVIYDKIKRTNRHIPPGSVFSKHEKHKAMFGSLGEEATNSIHGENIYTAQKYLDVAAVLKGYPNALAKRADFIRIAEWSFCLPSVFLFYFYTQNECGGIRVREVATTFRHLERYDFNAIMGQMAEQAESHVLVQAALKEIDSGADILGSVSKFLNSLRKPA